MQRIRRRKSRSLADFYLPLMLFAAAGYFAVNAFLGNNGHLQLNSLEKRIEARASVLERMRADRDALEADIDLLADEHVSADLLEERVREVFGYTRPDEYVILKRDLRD